MSEIVNTNYDLKYNLDYLNKKATKMIPDGMANSVNTDIITCGEILFIKNAWSVLYQCSYCEKRLENLDIFLKHSIGHIFELTGEDDVDKKLASLLKTTAYSGAQDADEVNGVDWTEPITIIKTEEINIIDAYDSDNQVGKDEEVETVSVANPLRHCNEDIKAEQNRNISKNFSLEQTTALIVNGDVQKEKIEMTSLDIARTSTLANTDISINRQTKKKKTSNATQKQAQEFVCPVCGKLFHVKKYYNNHIVRHKTERPYKCEICDAGFNDRSNLNEHRRRHLGVQPHQCEHCEKRFTTRNELRVHQRSHTGEKPFVCEKCGASYSTSSHLQDHMRRHTNTRPHVCGECGKQFYNKGLLNGHLLTHSEARPFKCDVCSMTFKSRNTLRQHQKLHMKLFEYKCPYCDKAFQQNAGMYSHIKNVHGKLKGN